MTTHSLNVTNQSDFTGSICVYQTNPGQEKDKDLFSVAWFSKPCEPGVSVTFEWDLDYCFVWSETGQLEHGARFRASQVIPADLKVPTNSVGFSHSDIGGYKFIDAPEMMAEGYLNVYSDNTVPNCRVSVGIGMFGKPTFVRLVGPNLTYSFHPKPTYWVTFGFYEEGQVIDANRVTQSAKVVFDGGNTDRSIYLDGSNLWRGEREEYLK